MLVSLAMLIINLFISNNGVSNTDLFSEPLTIASLSKFLASFNVLSSLIDNVAVGAWLFHRAKYCGYNRWLWAAFGLAGSLVGGVLYFLARAYESGASNKSNQQGPAAGTR